MWKRQKQYRMTWCYSNPLDSIVFTQYLAPLSWRVKFATLYFVSPAIYSYVKNAFLHEFFYLYLKLYYVTLRAIYYFVWFFYLLLRIFLIRSRLKSNYTNGVTCYSSLTTLNIKIFVTAFRSVLKCLPQCRVYILFSFHISVYAMVFNCTMQWYITVYAMVYSCICESIIIITFREKIFYDFL